MIYNKSLFLLMISFSLLLVIDCWGNPRLEEEIKLLENKLYDLQLKIKNQNKSLNELKKILVITLIKKNITKKAYFFWGNEKNYYKIDNQYKLYTFLYQSTERRIKENQAKIKILQNEYEKKIKKLKELKEKYAKVVTIQEEMPKISPKKERTKKHLIDPITKESIIPGHYKKSVRPGTPVKAPHSGIIKKISFIADTFTIYIEGSKCNSILSGLSVLKVNIGEEILTGQLLGEAGFSEEESNLQYIIKCHKL